MIKGLPNDKSPGLDGFNNEFLKSCWTTIKGDFYRMCNDFHSNNICLRSINSSFITLILKVDGPKTVNDYRPISLLNSSVKLLTKLLANRLQTVITELVHRNQYGFIKNRSLWSTYICVIIQTRRLSYSNLILKRLLARWSIKQC